MNIKLTGLNDLCKSQRATLQLNDRVSAVT